MVLEIFISPKGSDENPGSAKAPLQSLVNYKFVMALDRLIIDIPEQVQGPIFKRRLPIQKNVAPLSSAHHRSSPPIYLF